MYLKHKAKKKLKKLKIVKNFSQRELHKICIHAWGRSFFNPDDG